ncbi:MAG TPA: hypothetical protein VLR54_04515 [Methanobacteriaceae archaeon]|nr:hypothetical protein [Methanobacteriaceae archaeon]
MEVSYTSIRLRNLSNRSPVIAIDVFINSIILYLVLVIFILLNNQERQISF